jgi:mRNA interferase MazF
MPRPIVGEVWRVDLGLTAKVRPCLVMSDYPAEDELALLLIIPHTTAVRGNRWEFACMKPFLKPGVFHLQQIQPISLPRLQSKLGGLTPEEFRGLKRHFAALLRLNE